MQKKQLFITLALLIVAAVSSISISLWGKKTQDITPVVYPDTFTTATPAVTNSPVIPASSPVPASFDYLFEGRREANTSNVVGYIGGDAFVIYVPDWVVEHWQIQSESDPNSIVVSPRNTTSPRSLSNIYIQLWATDELINADTLYDTYLHSQNPSDIVISEIFLNKTGDMRIYHIETSHGSSFDSQFFLDGNGKTARISFGADKENFNTYQSKIREFVQGFGPGKEPQG